MNVVARFMVVSIAVFSVLATYLYVWKPVLPAQLTTLSGDSFRLLHDGNRSKILAFWSSDCSSCLAEIKAINALYDASKVKHIDLLLVVMPEDIPSRVIAMQQSQGWLFPVSLDYFARLSDRYRIEAIPTTVFVDPEGHVRYQKTGQLNAEQFIAAIDRL